MFVSFLSEDWRSADDRSSVARQSKEGFGRVARLENGSLATTRERKVRTVLFKKILVLATALVAAASFASGAFGASASGVHVQLYRPIPEGIDPNNAAKAASQVLSRAAWDGQYARTLATQTGATTFKTTDYKPVGYQNSAPPGTDNSAVNGATGQIVPVKDHDGSDKVRVLILMNVVSKKTVAIGRPT